MLFITATTENTIIFLLFIDFLYSSFYFNAEFQNYSEINCLPPEPSNFSHRYRR